MRGWAAKAEDEKKGKKKRKTKKRIFLFVGMSLIVFLASSLNIGSLLSLMEN
jgi:hypothetical protein